MWTNIGPTQDKQLTEINNTDIIITCRQGKTTNTKDKNVSNHLFRNKHSISKIKEHYLTVIKYCEKAEMCSWEKYLYLKTKIPKWDSTYYLSTNEQNLNFKLYILTYGKIQ